MWTILTSSLTLHQVYKSLNICASSGYTVMIIKHFWLVGGWCTHYVHISQVEFVLWHQCKSSISIESQMWWICILSSIFNVLLPLLSTDIGASKLGHQWALGILSRAKEENSCANFWHAPKQEATGKPTSTRWCPDLAHSEDVKRWPTWLHVALKSFFEK